MRNRRRPGRVGLLAAAVVFVAGLAFAGAATSARPVPVTGFRLAAVLGPTSGSVPTTAKGRLDAVLVGTGGCVPGTELPCASLRVGTVGRLPTTGGCVIVQQPRRARPRRVACTGGLSGPVPAFGHWLLLWRLTYSGLSGSATGAHVRVPTVVQGKLATTALALCTSCSSTLTGHLDLTAQQAAALAMGRGTAAVNTAANPGGEIAGPIRPVLTSAKKPLGPPTGP